MEWSRVAEDEIRANVKGYEIAIKRQHDPRRSAFILHLSGTPCGYYSSLDAAKVAAGLWLRNQEAFDATPRAMNWHSWGSIIDRFWRPGCA